ncbi:hypothetical protein EJ03DRAFT_324292 [Teratosphaeria nubilosa]|uniref:N-acetyltransferase domain-containing protein n=1 Tax=Teratosphaeria nubilosa TaxID=161662 RepID=A0A6G1LIL6_9PEZI|nr:hypothetical protein EJ03DRAFT_324292 [Teratosphaeria nubilosa]
MDKSSFPAALITVKGGEEPTLTDVLGRQKLNQSFARVDSVTSVKDEGVSARSQDTVATAASDSGNVRVLGLHEWKNAAASLAESFWEDHSSRYFIDTPDRADWTEEQKWSLHVKIMEYITYAHLLKGLVVCAGPSYDCIGLWMPPRNNMDDMLTIFRSGMWRLNWQLSKEGRKRFFHEFLPLLGDTKAQVLAERDLDSYYLVYLGTRPSARGRGYAKTVVNYVTRKADAEARACYLESSSAVNRMIYGKMGFELKKVIYLQRAEENVELDIMVREPVQVKAAQGGITRLM